jgi:hydroxyacylglutathione hydrolase
MQITKNIHALKIPFQMVDPSGKRIERFVYVYVLCGKKIYLIDSGVASFENTIFDYLMERGRSPQEISILILTHSHPDHIGGAYAVQKASGCEIAAHSAERSWIEDTDQQLRERPVPGFRSLVGGSVKVDRILEDDDILDLEDDLGLKVLHTPGHSKGSISLLLQREGVLFSGDVIPLLGDMPIYEDAAASVASIKRLKAISGINHLLSAWDDPQADGNAYQRMDEGLRYLQSIHDAVMRVSSSHTSLEPMDLCMRVLRELGLPETAANPLIARSFEANLNLGSLQDLLAGDTK